MNVLGESDIGDTLVKTFSERVSFNEKCKTLNVPMPIYL